MAKKLSKPQRHVLGDALRLVREQRARAEAQGLTGLPDGWARPFVLGYLMGVVDGLCQAKGVTFDETALAIWGLVLDDTFGRPASDDLRRRGVALLNAGDPAFERGRPWGGNEAMGFATGEIVPEGLVHVARGDEARMGGPVIPPTASA
ncbi:hypothetical protein [Rubrivirga sp. IMCC43871]|uniref:hypothetical protein n=1 Tax=Rubrivirga sp. IMCC43871 TaxID=3391575 RepID=UPI00398F9344